MIAADESGGRSRRRFLLTAGSLAPLAAGARAWGQLLGRRAGFQSTAGLVELGAREAVDHIRNGDIRAEVYVEALLAQYRAHRNLNVATTIDGPRVLEAARAVDRARARGATLGPAAGLPFAVKDQIFVAGYPSTGGNGALKSHVPQRNAAVVERLMQAGAIPFCLTTLPDMVVVDGLMHQASSYSESFGPVRNPYDPTRIPGGSSGGNGAILAARIVPAALGVDSNGSIRCPSAFCGVAGLRPSTFTIQNALERSARKRYSDDGLLRVPVGRLDTIGPMARTVADVAFLDTLVTGEPTRPVDLSAARIAVPGPRYWEQGLVDPAVAGVIREAFARLRAAGCRLVEIDLDREVRSIVGTIDRPAMATIIAGDGLDAPVTSREVVAAWLREHAPGVSLEQLYRGRPSAKASRSFPPVEEQKRILNDAAHRYAEIYRSHGVMAIAFPTVPIGPSPILSGGPEEPVGPMITVNGQRIEEGKALIQNLFIAPRMGAPGLSLPAGMTGGLPVGLELDAMPGKDSELLGLGMAVQKVLGPIPPPFSS